jgi:hypothetical protein
MSQLTEIFLSVIDHKNVLKFNFMLLQYVIMCIFDIIL